MLIEFRLERNENWKTNKGKKFLEALINIYFHVYQLTTDTKRSFLLQLKNSEEKLKGLPESSDVLFQIREIMLSFKLQYLDKGIKILFYDCCSSLQKSIIMTKVYNLSYKK